jgi:glucose-6-phosphate 1-epimerase
MRAVELNQKFSIPEVLGFAQSPTGLVYAEITTASASATIYLHGAHVALWQPRGTQPVLFMGAENDFSPADPIRGGIPIIFPWFGGFAGTKKDGVDYPMHGFARITPWDVVSAKVCDDDLLLVFALPQNEQSRALGFDGLRLEYSLSIGSSLRLEMIIHNESTETRRIEAGLHTYFAIDDIARTTLDGLGKTTYLDGTDSGADKLQSQATLHFARTTNSIYQNTTTTCTIHDPGNGRRISIAKSGFDATVVWNPWSHAPGALPGLGPDDWHKFLCVESVNVRDNAIQILPGATHRLSAIYSVLTD